MSTIYIAMPDALLVVRRQGRQDGAWHGEHRLEGLPAQCVAADPLRPEIVCCGTFGRGLWRSVDAGATWGQVGAGAFRSPQIMAVALSGVERAGEHAVLYAGTEPSTLYRSEDGGETWRELTALLALPSAPTWSFPPRPYTSHVRAIGLDPDAAGRLYVAIEAGALVRSFDGGRTWEDRRPSGPFDTQTLGLPSQLPGRIYSAAGDGFMRPGQGFVESRDAGDTWERPSAGLEHHYLWGLAVDPGDPETLIVSAAHSPNEAHNPIAAASVIYRRASGSAWQRVAEGLPAERGMLASVLAANQAEPGAFYVANNRGLYRSADAGRSWERLDILWPEGED
ncbi:MAG TPA: sialidase family protein, partial [Ktedonobacterales bacterium]|nr:sialidase family protein [Ktedonobacterales bacterium]